MEVDEPEEEEVDEPLPIGKSHSLWNAKYLLE